MLRLAALLLVCSSRVLLAANVSELARQILQAGLDVNECYRVRDLTLLKEDARIYLTDGYLIFGEKIADAPVTAIFSADVEGGDAELLLLPPSRSERQSLASFSGAPNLNEHFRTAAFVFTDDTYRAVTEQIRAGEPAKKSPEMGLLLKPAWDTVVQNLASSFETRLVYDLLRAGHEPQGMFFAALAGRQLGNFDLVYDPRSVEQITVGQTVFRDGKSYFDVWTAFEARSFRNHARTPTQAEFTLKDYRIDVTLRPPDLGLDVITKVTVHPGASPLAVLPFEITQQMHVTGASVDGEPAAVFEREALRSNLIRQTGNQLFLVIPAKPLRPSRDYEVEIHHAGAVVTHAGNRVYYVGSRMNWYPNRRLQFAQFDLTFRYPKDLDLVSSGELVEDRNEGDWRVTRRRTTAPIRLAGFNLGVYERVRIARGGCVVDVCANRNVERALQAKPREPEPVTPPAGWPRAVHRPVAPMILNAPPDSPAAPNPTARLNELAAEIASALEFMAARFGPPPLRTLTVSPVPGFFGQGFPGLIYLSTLAYLGPKDKAIAGLKESTQTFFREILYAHETAHQWWGNLVTAARYQDQWMMEGLANYSALLLLEKRKGSRALDTVLDEYRADLMAKGAGSRTVESAGPIALGARLDSSQSPGAWRTILYEKSSWILHMLRRRIGDEKFFAMLGELRRRWEGKPIGTEDFRELAAGYLPPKSPDPKLEMFFEQWVYSTGIPTLKLKYSIHGKAPSLKLTGTVSQANVDEDFAALVPVEIQLGKAKPIIQWVRTSSDPAPFTVRLRQMPAKVLLDPQNTVLALHK